MARKMASADDMMSLAQALAVLRDPSGDGSTKVSHGFGDDMKPVARFAKGDLVTDGTGCIAKVSRVKHDQVGSEWREYVEAKDRHGNTLAGNADLFRHVRSTPDKSTDVGTKGEGV